jgi:hypothetical protein
MMLGFLQVWERRARFLMGIVCVLLATGALMFKLGWISTASSYSDSAWYSVSEHAGFVVTTEHADEAGCKAAAQTAAVICRSGKSLAPGRKAFSS